MSCQSQPEGFPGVECVLPACHEGMHRDAKFTMLWHEDVAAHLEGLGRDVAAARPPCALRVLSLPGMTSRVFTAACKEAGVLTFVRCVDGQTRPIWPKVGDVAGVSWWKIYRAAQRILGAA